MSLESVFKLSLVMNMIDNLSGPMAGVASRVGADVSKLDALSNTFGGMAKAGAAMTEAGTQITSAVLSPVEATFETKRALSELASLGVQDLGTLETAARNFSDQWSGITKALRIFLCSDLSLDDETILEYYSHRWKIEVMFRSQKRYMGFKSFMVRAAKAFDRLLTILCLAHFCFTCGLGNGLPFEASIRSCRLSLGILTKLRSSIGCTIQLSPQTGTEFIEF